MSVVIDRVESEVTVVDADGGTVDMAAVVEAVVAELDRRRRREAGDALLERALQVRRRASLSWS